MTEKRGLRAKNTTVVSYPAPHCVQCGNACEPVSPRTVQEDGTWNSLQVSKGLVLSIDGGYGMYLDSDNRLPQYVLCGSCIEEICATPAGKWLDTIIREGLEEAYDKGL